MAILNNTDLAAAISDADCVNCENINDETLSQMNEGEAIFIVPIEEGGEGISTEQEADVVGTLVQISEGDADEAMTLITTKYEIISKNGYPT